MATTKPTYVDENGNVYTMLGNIRGPAGKDGINGKSIYANTVDPWSVSGWNPVVAGDLFLNTTTGILWSAKAGAVTSNVQSNWTKVGELAGKITVDSALSSTSTNPVQNKVIKSALDGKAGSSHSHSSLTNSSGRVFNVPTGGSGGEQKTLVITDDLNAYQPAGNYASSTHKHPISDINDLQSTIDGIHTDMGLQDEAIAGKADSVHTHKISNIDGLQSALNGKSNLDHNHDSVYQAKGDYATNDTLKSYVTGTTFIDYTTYIEGEVNKKANASHGHDISDINGLQSALDGKSGVGHTHSEYVTGTDFNAYTSWIEGEVNGKSDIGHTHSISNVSGLQSALDGKSNTGHGHTISNITNLQSTIESIYSDMGLQDEAIAGKSDIGHKHKKSEITDLTIPTVNNPTITINQGGTKKGSFSLNQSGAATIDLTDNNTTYSAGTGLSLSGTTFSVSSANVSTMMNLLSEGTSDPTDNDYYIAQWAGGGTTTTTYHRRPVSKLYNYMKGKFDSIYQAKGSYAASSHTHNYLPLSGGTMTGPISYQGTKAKYTMINWIDNTGDTYGNGIRIGGGGATIIGGGESASLPNVSGGNEILYLMNDGDIDFYSNCQDGLSSAKHMSFDTSGNLNVPTNVKVNGNSVIHSGNIGSQNVNYANSAGSVAWGNVTGKPSTYTPASHTHTSLKSNTDNRNTNTTPNDYNGVLNIAGLKGNDKIGLDTNIYGTYSCLIGVRGWGDSSGGNAHELAFTGNGHIAHRHGSTTSWGSWNRIAHVSDIPTKLPASNISMSFSNGVLTITYNS